jgi:hypothetical protein
MVIDDLQRRVPPIAKWCLAGIGAVGGWHFAQTNGSPIPASCIAAGIAGGLCFLCVGFAGLRLLRLIGIVALTAVLVNYGVLIPYGYGDHLPGWVATGKAVVGWLNPSPLVKRWGR